jgi:hypothetical protein
MQLLFLDEDVCCSSQQAGEFRANPLFFDIGSVSVVDCKLIVNFVGPEKLRRLDKGGGRWRICDL